MSKKTEITPEDVDQMFSGRVDMRSLGTKVQRYLPDAFDKQFNTYSEAVADLLTTLLNRLGQPLDLDKMPKFIGAGEAAHVYWCYDKRKVLKITSDLSDAQAMLYFKKHPDKHIVQVYDVFKFPKTSWYGIFVEKLTPVKDQWENIATYLPFVVKKYFALDLKWWEYFQEVIKDPKNLPHGLEHDLTPEVLETIKGWCTALTKANIVWRDIHEDNVMMRGRQPVLMDLGMAKGTRGSIPVL